MIYSNEQKNNLRIKIDYNNMMKKYIGEYGIADAELSALAGKDRKSTRLNSSHVSESRMPSSA